MKKKFYSVHVFYSRNDGYSIPVVIETNNDFLTEEEVINFVAANDLLSDESDANQIDCIDEIDRQNNILLVFKTKEIAGRSFSLAGRIFIK